MTSLMNFILPIDPGKSAVLAADIRDTAEKAKKVKIK